MHIYRQGDIQVFMTDTKYYQTYIVTNRDKTVMIDTGLAIERAAIEAGMEKDFLFSVDAIFLTHGHADNSGNAEYFSMLFNCPVYCPKLSLPAITRGHVTMPPPTHPYAQKIKNYSVVNQMPDFAPFEGCPTAQAITPIVAKEWLGDTARLIATPGHSEDSVSYQVGDICFIGDSFQNTKKGVCAPLWMDNEKQLRLSMQTLGRLHLPYYFPAHGKAYSVDEWQEQRQA